LYIDATHKCGLRTSGAQNWEAWIKDTRDNELYRIVLMPDTKWWLAQNVKLASYNGSTVGMVACSGCNKDECGRSYLQTEVIAARGGTGGSGANIQGVCPPDWVLPLRSDMINFFNTIQPTISWNTHTATSIEGVICYAPNLIMLLTKSDNRCGTAQDYYGWATLKPCWDSREGCEGFMTGLTSGSYENYILNNMAGTYNDCGYVTIFNTTITYYKGAVRCFRQL
jgi:uncharacterized protein (TIGR02145 family)